MPESEIIDAVDPGQKAAIAQLGPVGELFTVRMQRVDHFFRTALRRIESDDLFRTGTLGSLSFIIQHPGESQNEIAKRTNMDKSAMNAIVNILSERGWVERRRDLNDRRRYALYATDAGITKMRQFIAKTQKFEAALLAQLSAPERAQLLQLLDTAYDSCQASEYVQEFGRISQEHTPPK